MPITSAQPAVHSPAAVRTEPPMLAVAYTAPAAAQLPATGPAAGQPTTTQRQDASADGTDRSDMAMMLLVALAMLTTLVFKGSRS